MCMSMCNILHTFTCIPTSDSRKRKSFQPKTTARVLTSENNLRLLKERERQKNEKEALKLERQRRKQEKALLKLEGIILLKIW